MYVLTSGISIYNVSFALLVFRLVFFPFYLFFNTWYFFFIFSTSFSHFIVLLVVRMKWVTIFELYTTHMYTSTANSHIYSKLSVTIRNALTFSVLLWICLHFSSFSVVTFFPFLFFFFFFFLFFLVFVSCVIFTLYDVSVFAFFSSFKYLFSSIFCVHFHGFLVIISFTSSLSCLSFYSCFVYFVHMLLYIAW